MKSYITLKGFEKLHTDKHGYFETGDVGEYKNGILFINGRTKDLIKKGGEIVSLNYIENISMKFKNVIESSAVGKDNINTGEDVILFVKYNKIKDLEIENKKLFDFLKSKLRTIEMPVKIIPVPLIPKTSNNKTIKNINNSKTH